MTNATPTAPKLSEELAEMITWLNATDELDPHAVVVIVAFLKRHMPQLQQFAADYEFAESKAPSAGALAMVAASAVRFYRRTAARGEPIVALAIIDLDKYRRPPLSEGGPS